MYVNKHVFLFSPQTLQYVVIYSVYLFSSDGILDGPVPVTR